MAEEKFTFHSFSKKEEKNNVSEQVDQDFTDYQEDSERDYRPIRQNRQGRTGCMGGIMYFLFVVSISVIIACLTWMAASDVLALNKDDTTAVVTLPTDIFEETKDEEGNTVVFASIYTPDCDESELLPIETDEEWDMVEKLLDELQSEEE